MTQERAHTELPWHAGHLADDSHPCNCACVISERYAGAICTVHFDNGLSISDGGNDCPPLEEAKANLRFIVRAVNAYPLIEELTKALEAAFNIVGDRSAGGRMITSKEEAKRAFVLCRDALSRAYEVKP